MKFAGELVSISVVILKCIHADFTSFTEAMTMKNYNVNHCNLTIKVEEISENVAFDRKSLELSYNMLLKDRTEIFIVSSTFNFLLMKESCKHEPA